jgi:nucleotide-binding universal stress UspA family protein
LAAFGAQINILVGTGFRISVPDPVHYSIFLVPYSKFYKILFLNTLNFLSFSKFHHMRTVIIPVDFSETSLNAARYAAGLLNGLNAKVFVYSMFDDDDEADTTEEYLKSLQAELIGKGLTDVEHVKERGNDLIENLSRLAQQKTATLIVMGITGRTGLAQVLIGSNTLKMVERNICPIMVVPPYAKFDGIKNVAFASDFKHKIYANSILFIKTILEMFKPALHIVNVSSEHYVSLTDEYQTGRSELAEIFNEYNPEFYFIGWFSFEDAITQFAGDKQIDFIITEPRYHSFWQGITKSSHTKKLVYQSTVPVVAVHE